MPQINFSRREILCKVVYYGPGLAGKTVNLEVIHKRAPRGSRGDLVSVATEGDRTLFFDYMPLDLGNVGGLKVKLQLYTVPGQPYYNATRELVLRGADGIVFVADSQADRLEENVRSFDNLIENLAKQGRRIDDVPLVMQWNKRDLPNALPVEELEKKVNRHGRSSVEAIAVTGEGVFPTLKVLTRMVLVKLNRDLVNDSRTPAKTERERTPEPVADEPVAPPRVEKRPTLDRKPERKPERERPTPRPLPALPPATPVRPTPPRERPNRWAVALPTIVALAAIAACAARQLGLVDRLGW